MFHRQYMHRMLMDSAIGEGEGPPAQLIVNHQVSYQIQYCQMLQPCH
jgi:salicylate hydroxylase